MNSEKRLKFLEFLEIHASLLPQVNFFPGSPAMVDLFRGWNSLAILFPEKCADVVVWGKGETPSFMSNDLGSSIDNTLKVLSERKLENLPDEYRSLVFKGRQREIETERAKIQELGLNTQQPPQENPNETQEPNVKENPEEEPEIPANEEGVVVPSHMQKNTAKKEAKATK